jgi:hypothetical protein
LFGAGAHQQRAQRNEQSANLDASFYRFCPRGGGYDNLFVWKSGDAG